VVECRPGTRGERVRLGYLTVAVQLPGQIGQQAGLLAVGLAESARDRGGLMRGGQGGREVQVVEIAVRKGGKGSSVNLVERPIPTVLSSPGHT
jgi:hypothetical protein